MALYSVGTARKNGRFMNCYSVKQVIQIAGVRDENLRMPKQHGVIHAGGHRIAVG